MRFAQWLVLPESKRQPKTQGELARELGVSRTTLSTWRRLPVIQAIVSDWRNSYKAHFNEVVDAMLRQARRGNVPAARLLAEILGELAPTKIESTTDSPFAALMTELRDMRAKPLEVLTGGKAAQK